MPRRDPNSSDWKLRPTDLPRNPPENFGSKQLDTMPESLPENFIFRWLTWRRRAGRFPRVFYFEPAMIGYLWGPVALFIFDYYFYFDSILSIFFFAGCAVLGLASVPFLLARVFIRGSRRGVLMNLPRHLLEEISLTGFSTDTIFDGIWGDALRPARQRRLRIKYILLILILAAICWNELGLMLGGSLVAWSAGRLAISYAAYPYADLPRIHRVVRAQAVAHLRRRWPSYAIGQFLLAIVGPMAFGFIAWIIYIFTTGLLFEAMSNEYTASEMIWHIIGLNIFWILIGGCAGMMRASIILNNHKQKIRDIKRLIDQILACEQGREPEQIGLLDKSPEMNHAPPPYYP